MEYESIEKEKDHECYLYDGNEEIGAFSNDGKAKHLKILGNTKAIPKSIAIEINGKIFIPLIDNQRLRASWA